ncbi:hypothetical protein ACTMTF_16595 [Nonomuraea sp. ZG12]|uniref:hypothetical protein n=1 Tax=Nonomuraea sp. ZG12 TaxID=3452207 RepID=UPI003F8BCDD7
MSTGAEKPGRTARPGQRVGIGLLIFAVLSAGFLFLNRDDNPRAAPEWKPGPFDPPVQYAFIPENSDCHDRLPPTSTTCGEWQLHVNYRTGEGRQELDILYGVSLWWARWRLFNRCPPP